MKIRMNYVSNSSSASFIIFNWFDIPAEKRQYIKNYDTNAMQVWKQNDVPYKFDKEYEDYHFSEMDMFNLIDEESPQNLKDAIYYEYKPFTFGWLKSCPYCFYESKQRNLCIISTSMTNFNMEKWLKYNDVNFGKLCQE